MQHGPANLDITYLLADNGPTIDNAPVLQSQVLDWIQIQLEQGIRAGLVADVADDARADEILRPIAEHPSAAVHTFTHRALPRNLFSAARALRQFQKHHNSPVVYARGLWAAMSHAIAYPIGGPELLYDYRGDVVEESRYRGASGLRLRVLDRAVRFGVKRAKRRSAVSGAAAKKMEAAYGVKNIEVFPSCIDTTKYAGSLTRRADVRSELGLQESDVLLVYAGSTSKYQMIPYMLDVWSRLGADPSIKFLLLTNATPLRGVDSIQVPEAIDSRLAWKSVDRTAVFTYLAAADIGFLLREEHPLNHVASPIKFAEYLTSGLAIVATPGLGDVTETVKEHDLGTVVTVTDIEDAVNKCEALIARARSERDEIRTRAQALALNSYDWNFQVPRWRKMIGMSALENVPVPEDTAT